MSTYCSAAVDEQRAEMIANTLRFLAVDGVEAAASGHPGMPMGCADIATVLLTRFLRVDPSKPDWFDRDRFVLSAGHGSMLLYAMLHLLGYLDIDELKRFRQVDSLTPGHPERGRVPGVEVTGGPLGAGFSHAAGLALAERLFAARCNTGAHEIVDHFTYVIMSDGCAMEGVTNEAASFAGHLQLGKLIVFYDDNEISIEGSTDLAFTEDVNARFAALGWHVQDIDGHDQAAIAEAVSAAQDDPRPSVIACHTTIGRGAPHLAGSAATHGAPLGAEETAAAKEAAGWPAEPFHVPAAVADCFADRKEQLAALRAQWDNAFSDYASAAPEKAAELQRIIDGKLPDGWEAAMPVFEPADGPAATRASGGKVLNAFAAAIPELVGGSGDLAPSTKTEMKGCDGDDFIAPGAYAGRNIHFGVREHAMGNIVNGLALHGLVPFGATFLVFHDYMRASLRLAALQGCRSIFVYTHDSIYVGEDGPTHQPVEQLAAIRAIPRIHVMRPCDANEVAHAWRYAIGRADAPTVLALTRQKLTTLDRDELGAAGGTRRGGYVLSCDGDPDIVLAASGSEVHLALDTAALLRDDGRAVRVVSIPGLKLFLQQDPAYRDEVLPPAVTRRVVLELGVRQGWGPILGGEGLFIGMEDFGTSGPWQELAEKYGFVPGAVREKIRAAFDLG